ncbi:MAG: amino acid ABC transporter permease [Candidatus Hodarchaeota archaeon]
MLQLISDLIEDLLKVMPYWPHILEGLWRTLWLYFGALIIGFFIGLLLAITRQYGGRIFSRIATGYIELLRGTPLLAQLFLIYFLPSSINAWLELQGLPTIQTAFSISIIDWLGRRVTLLDHRMIATLVMLSLNSAAYQAEYIRGSIASISAGQLLAARSVGMSQTGGIRHVILPQALRRAIPSWSNEAVYLPKFTVVGYFIGVEELFAKAHLIASATFVTLAIYGIVAIIFLLLISALSFVLDYVHKRTKIPGMFEPTALSAERGGTLLIPAP